MSRIGRMPIELPTGVEVKIGDGNTVTVNGPKGTLTQQFNSNIAIQQEGNVVSVTRPNDLKENRSLHGLTRTLLNNMVIGVTKGFEKKLTLVGVGYRAQAQGAKLNLTLGFSHPVVHDMPTGIKVETPTQTEVLIKGIDKQVVGQVAAEVRAYRSPEPYKGKGVRYADEVVAIKETKKK